jgi:hypothetical protein
VAAGSADIQYLHHLEGGKYRYCLFIIRFLGTIIKNHHTLVSAKKSLKQLAHAM